MDILVLGIIMFLDIIYYLIIFDVILSWLTLAGIKFRPKIIGDILGPVYKIVKRTIPTTFGGLDFTPIVIILLVYFIKGTLLILSPETGILINSFVK